MKEVDGDLIDLALKGKFDVITHGCNCFCNMGAGIAVPMKNTFGCDRFDMEYYHSIEKLGCIDYQTFVLGEKATWNLLDADNKRGEPELTVVNSYTQYKYGRGVNIDYEALTLCMRKINGVFKGKHIGLPKIGAGLAGGNWYIIRDIIKKELKDCEVTIVNYVK